MANVVLPRVRLFVPCLNVTLESGQARVIVDPIHTIRMTPGENRYDIWFYAQLTDGVGSFRLFVELQNDEGIIVGRTLPHRIDFPGGSQLVVHELKLVLEQAPFANPGIYVFKLIANHSELGEMGTATLRVLAE